MKNSLDLSYRNIYILPSQRGLAFVALIVLLLTIAAIYNNNLVYLLSFLLASIFFITILHTVKSMAGLKTKLGNSPAIFLGESTKTILWVNNPTVNQRYSLQINAQEQDIPAQDKTAIILRNQPKKRGWYTSPPPIISSRYPFGLFRAWVKLKFTIKTLVYPQPSTENIPFPENSSTDNQQGFAQQQGQDDFYGIQKYQAGDSIRHIHWRAFAKGQGLSVKQFSSENHSAEIIIDYELTRAATQEQRLSQMCRWVIEAHKAGINYGFKLGTLNLKPQLGSAHYQKCLTALALF
ncbi:MAG: DUF58 domain-containing protein [Methyloprofundus sp.]|nr:DUF58 domain-containing protein [Methyloprofundus sp.]